MSDENPKYPDDVPDQHAITGSILQTLSVGVPDLPQVSLSKDFKLTVVDPMSRTKTYEKLLDYKYDRSKLDADSEAAGVVSRGGKVIVPADIRYAEVSETYLGSDGKYYVATFARVYVPAESMYFDQYEGSYAENHGTLMVPGSKSFKEKYKTIVGDTHQVTAGGFDRIRLATQDEINKVESYKQDVLDKGFTLNSDGTYNSPDKSQCFTAGTAIMMGDGGARGIEDIQADDVVMSFNDAGDLVPARVVRTFQKDVEIVLDFWGTGVTPGHVFYRADHDGTEKFQTLIDVLCDDGVIETADGQHIRAATGAEVGSPKDGFVWAFTGARMAGTGEFEIQQKAQIRRGTLVEFEGRDICVEDLIIANGGVVDDEGYIFKGDQRMMLHWTLSERLPEPADYILQRSNTSVEAIRRAGEWDERHMISAELS